MAAAADPAHGERHGALAVRSLADVHDLLSGRGYFGEQAPGVPVLIVRGADDAYPNDADGRALAQRLGGAGPVQYRVVPDEPT